MNNPKIKITVRDYGELTAELYPESAPKTVENFLRLAGEGFYTGTIFHRVIKGFMIQGGGYDEDFGQKEAPQLKGEFAANGWAKNNIPHTRGVLSMARTSDPDSASSQFFVMHTDSPHLNSQYAAFGRVAEGLEVIDRIASVKTGNRGWHMQDVPRDAVVIEKIEIIES